MTPTMHMAARMAQRGIKKRMVELAMAHGEQEGDRVVFYQKAIRERIDELKQEQKALEHALKKGGITVVTAGERMLTTYRTSSFRRGRRR